MFQLNCDATSIGDNEKFYFIDHGNNIYSLRSKSKNKYLTITNRNRYYNNFNISSNRNLLW